MPAGEQPAAGNGAVDRVAAARRVVPDDAAVVPPVGARRVAAAG